MPAEKRKQVRRPLRRPAWIDRGPGTAALECVLWDISDGGAKLAAAHGRDQLPHRFELVLANGNLRRECRVRWRGKKFVGVAFVGRGKRPAS